MSREGGQVGGNRFGGAGLALALSLLAVLLAVFQVNRELPLTQTEESEVRSL